MDTYEICVSHNGRWFFTTKGIDIREQARDVYGMLEAKFPESDGYKVSVIKWNNVGEYVDFD